MLRQTKTPQSDELSCKGLSLSGMNRRGFWINRDNFWVT